MKIVIIKKDGSEEFSSYHEYAEKLSAALPMKHHGEITSGQWAEYFAAEFAHGRKFCLNNLERHAKIVDRGIFDIISHHQWKRNKLREMILVEAIARIGDKEYLVEYSYPNYDDDFGGGHGEARKTYSTRDMLEELYDDDLSCRNTRDYSSSCIRRIKTEKELRDAFVDKLSNDDCFVQFIGSEEDYRKLEQKRRREELEGLAGEIAQKHKVGIRSVEFLKAVRKEIDAVNYEREEWNNPEVRMEEFAACRYAGVGTDVYFDDLNFVNGRIHSRADELHGIMEWMAENCPMLYAQYCEESKDESEENDDDDLTELERELMDWSQGR